MSRSEAPQYPGPTQLVSWIAVTAAWKQQWVGGSSGAQVGDFHTTLGTREGPGCEAEATSEARAGARMNEHSWNSGIDAAKGSSYAMIISFEEHWHMMM